MWRYALPGVAIVGAVIALFVGALTLTGNQRIAPGTPTLRTVSDQSSRPAGHVPDTPIPRPVPGTGNPIDTRLPPPPDLDAAQKAAAEASQALAAVQREREAERALMAKQAQSTPVPQVTPPPSAQVPTEPERQTRVQELDQQIAQRNQTLADVNRGIDQARQTLAGLQQQQDAERAALNKLKTQDEPALMAERDKLQSQIGDLTAQVTQQKNTLDATRANITQAEQALAGLRKQQGVGNSRRPAEVSAKVASKPTDSFSVVQGIVDNLRRRSAQNAEATPPPPPLQTSDPADTEVQRPASAVPQPPSRSSWRSLMAARQAIATGDPGQARVLLVSSQHALHADPAAEGGFAAAQVAEALSLLDAGAPVRAMHYLDLAIANLSRTPQAAASQSEQP